MPERRDINPPSDEGAMVPPGVAWPDEKAARESDHLPFGVVGIGASAGGIDAFRSLLGAGRRYRDGLRPRPAPLARPSEQPRADARAVHLHAGARDPGRDAPGPRPRVRDALERRGPPLARNAPPRPTSAFPGWPAPDRRAVLVACG